MPAFAGGSGNSQRGASPAFLHGRAFNGNNTGVNYLGLTAPLTPVSGPQTYSANGQVVEGKLFNNRIDITGSVTIRNCALSYSGADTFGFLISGGGNVLIEGCVITAPAGQSISNPIFVSNSGGSVTVRRCDISNCCQFTTTYGSNVLFEENYGHDVSTASDPTNHPDGNEVYGGANIIYRRNRFMMGPVLFDGVFNVAPYQAGNPSVDNLLVADNYLQGGQEIILVDHQAPSGDCTNIQILRNDMDQHTNPDTGGSFGVNRAFTDYQSRGVVATPAAQAANPSALLWPTSGPDINRWVNPDGVTPDYAGMIVVPPQSAA